MTTAKETAAKIMSASTEFYSDRLKCDDFIETAIEAALKQEQARSAKLVEALEFYAEMTRWEGDRLLHESKDYGDARYKDSVYGDTYIPSGKRAREALATCRAGDEK